MRCELEHSYSSVALFVTESFHRTEGPEVNTTDTWASAAHRRAVYLILAVVGISILFDGYDLVIYGAVLSSLTEGPPTSASSPPPSPTHWAPTP